MKQPEKVMLSTASFDLAKITATFPGSDVHAMDIYGHLRRLNVLQMSIKCLQMSINVYKCP